MSIQNYVHVIYKWMWRFGYKEGWALKTWCFWTVVLEKTLESLLDCKEIKPVHPQVNQPWIFIRKTDAEAPILWPSDVKRPWCQERLRTGVEEGDRGWDGWMALLIQWTWVWANSGRWWRTGKPGMLQFMGSQRVGHSLSDWTTTYVCVCVGGGLYMCIYIYRLSWVFAVMHGLSSYGTLA